MGNCIKLSSNDEIPLLRGIERHESSLDLEPAPFVEPPPPYSDRSQVLPPAFRELPPPSWELFDLDEQFLSEKVRIAQITNKCTDDDLEYYVRECGDILGVTHNLPQESRTAKHVLEYVFTQIVEFQKLNQDVLIQFLTTDDIKLNVIDAKEPEVFPPAFRELPPPSLELDEQFSSEKVRIAQITNKCTDDDLEYYVRECGDILGVTHNLPQESKTAKHVLEYVFTQIVEFQKLNQEGDFNGGMDMA